ncbi:NfeD family protein [Novosphingobium sp.]|uniref:NfeD family protein n=1 Tax=Novosphingobium sp. TaxID=1874826 RepID=UPI002621C68F|nr:NfeD family protein [Novosphingobium sp.]
MTMVQEMLGEHWGWIALGVALAIAEIIAPGYFLIWLAAAALVTGLVAAAMPIGLSAEVLLFAMLSALALAAAKRWFARHPGESADPMLNDRGGQLVGQSAVVSHVIEGGTGRVRHGDTEWLARGPDSQPGTRMRIIGSEGTVLIVEHLH